MAYIDSPRFPPELSYGSSGGPEWSTEVTPVESGAEHRNAKWSNARRSFDVAHTLKKVEQLDLLLNFFHIARGKANTFRFKDWTDYSVSHDTGRLVRVGSSNKFQLSKVYTAGPHEYVRKITKPIAGLVINKNGGSVSYTLDLTTGLVELPGGFANGDNLTWAGEFDTHCRFDTDKMNVNIEFYNAYTWGQIPVIEVLEP